MNKYIVCPNVVRDMKKRVGQRKEDQQFLVGLGTEWSGQSHLPKKVRFQQKNQCSEINT